MVKKPDLKRVAFEALIHEVKARKLACEDKGGRIVLEFNTTGKQRKLIGQLDELFDPDKEVFVVIAEKPE